MAIFGVAECDGGRVREREQDVKRKDGEKEKGKDE